MTRLTSLVALAAAIGPLSYLPATAQETMINLTGTVAAVQPGLIAMTTKEKQQYVIALEQNSKVTVRGTAKTDFLKPGTYLRFVAELDDKKWTAKGELTELAIYIPEERNAAGVVRNDPAATEGPYQVTGVVRSLKKGKLTVGAGSKSVKADIKDDAKIDLASEDYSLAKEGDEITVKGRLLEIGQTVGNNVMPGRAIGDEVQIKLAQPASAPSKKKGRVKKAAPSDSE